MISTAHVRRNSALAPHAALLAVQLIFGTWPIIGKIALRQLPSTGLVTFRVVGAAVVFAILRRTTRLVKIERHSDYLRLALYSLLGVVLNQFLFVKGLALSTVINATLLGTAIPIFTLIVSVIIGRERLSVKKILGILLAIAGVIYLVNPTRADLQGGTGLGNFLLIANATAYGAYIALSQDVVKRYGALTVITWIFAFGSIATLPIGGFYLAQTPLQDVSLFVWLAIVYIILVPTVAAYYLNAWSLERVAPSTVAAYIYLQPLIAFALAPLILGEHWNEHTWAAAVLIFSGVAVVTWDSRAKNRSANEVQIVPARLSE
ncbi:MAG: EamA family transporter [Pyrinomonadaceae bacterium]|nr:EamA family transporter [Pyrinomonadaceae bacterium]